MDKKRVIFILVILAFFLPIIAYNNVPEQIASHWNASGEVDGYMSKFWGLFLMPIMTLALTILLFLLPTIDPLKKNIKKFYQYYLNFILIFIIFMLTIELQIILWNIGIEISPIIILPIAIGLLFFYIGIILNKVEPNWFFGIRTPWTLSDKEVWKKTHDVGSTMFKMTGIITMIGIFFPKYVILFIIIPVLITASFLVIYSYSRYKK